MAEIRYVLDSKKFKQESGDKRENKLFDWLQKDRA